MTITSLSTSCCPLMSSVWPPIPRLRHALAPVSSSAAGPNHRGHGCYRFTTYVSTLQLPITASESGQLSSPPLCLHCLTLARCLRATFKAAATTASTSPSVSTSPLSTTCLEIQSWATEPTASCPTRFRAWFLATTRPATMLSDVQNRVAGVKRVVGG